MRNHLLLANIDWKLQKKTLHNQGLSAIDEQHLVVELRAISQLMKELQHHFPKLHTYLFIPVEDVVTSKELQSFLTYCKKLLAKQGFRFPTTTIEWLPLTEKRDLESMDNYDQFFSTILHKWGFPELYIPVQHGKPLLQSALMMQALLHWGNHVHPIWLENRRLVIHELNHLLPRRTMKQLLLKWVRNHDYHAVVRTLDLEDLTHNKEESERLLALSHVAKSIIARLNYHFEEAKIEWEKAEILFSKPPDHFLWKQVDRHLQQLTSTKQQRTSDLQRIVELYQQLLLYLEIKDIPAFLIRFYRFREAVLLYIGKYGQISEAPISFERGSSIHKTIADIQNLYDEWEIDGYYGAYFYCKSKNVADTLLLRNHSFVGHGRLGYSFYSVWKEYSGYVEVLNRDGFQRFEHDTGIMLRDLNVQPDNSILKIRDLLLILLNEMEV